MATPKLSSLFRMGWDVLSTALDTASNIITVTLGDSTSGQTYSPNAEWMQHSGFASVAGPSNSQAPSCQTVAIRQGDKDVVIASRDARACDRYANLKPGECCLYATVGQARVLCKADGTVTLYTTDDNTKTGNAVFFRIGGLKPDGKSYVGFQFVAPFGSFVFDDTGWHVRHSAGSGFRLDAGAISGLPGPLSTLSTYFNITAGTIKAQGSLVMLGSGPLFNPAVFVLAEDPLTSPGIPLTAPGYNAPWGGYSSVSVRVSGSPGTG